MVREGENEIMQRIEVSYEILEYRVGSAATGPAGLVLLDGSGYCHGHC